MMKIFLSYPSERLKVAREIFEFTKSLGMDVWFDKESLIVGQDWDRERAEAQRTAMLTILVCSPETMDKNGVIQREIKDILDHLRDKPIGQIYLLPARTEDVRLPSELAKYQYFNHFEDNWKTQLARSIELKHKQARIDVHENLRDFLETSQSPEPISIRYFQDENEIIDISCEFFAYNIPGEYWAYLNAVILTEVMSGVYRARHMFDTAPEDENMKNMWSIRVEEFFRYNEAVSLRFFVSWYGTGAAHPNSHTYSFNFGGTNIGKFDLDELLDHDADAALRLIKYSNHDLRRQYADQDDFEFLSFPSTAEEGWEAFKQFNFDNDGITLNFDPYELLPYAFGPQEVRVPWRIVRDKIVENRLTLQIREVIGSEDY